MSHPAIAEERTAASFAPLRPRPDQPERWHSFSQPVPFDVAAQQVLDAHRVDGEREDIVTSDLRSWAFGATDQETMQLVRIPFAGREVGEPLSLRELAFSQLAARLGAPAPYIRQLPPRLQTACINYGLAQKKNPALLRLAGGEVRAVLSDRYAAADDEQVLDMVGDCLDRAGLREDALVRAASTGPHTVLRITLPNEGVAVKVGDVIEYGIDLANSELGIRAVSLVPVTYRLVCLNGLRAWRSEAAVRMRHIGDPSGLHEQLRDALPVALAEARGDIERWRRAVDTLIDNALAEVESLRGFGLSVGEARDVGAELARNMGALPAETGGSTVTELLRGAKTTLFDVTNAITATARERGSSTAARLTLEETAHRYLTRRVA